MHVWRNIHMYEYMYICNKGNHRRIDYMCIILYAHYECEFVYRDIHENVTKTTTMNSVKQRTV